MSTLFPPCKFLNPVDFSQVKLNRDRHLAYCTNIHRGETWAETLQSLKTHTLAVRECVCPKAPFAIGLRLSNAASVELSDRTRLLEFQKWLEQNSCYVFTINGFPYGRFHGAQVKERVYTPDWTSPERLAYTNRLFDLLAAILPDGVAGSVSTVPGSFKDFIQTEDQQAAIRNNLWRCLEHVARVAEKSKRRMHLALEPEPLCLIENSPETVRFFDRLRADHKNDRRLDEHLGVNYDACHFAVEFEEPRPALETLRDAGIQISKIHLSSALKTRPTPEALAALKNFSDDVYLHQVVTRDTCEKLNFFRDLPDAFSARESGSRTPSADTSEWRIHFHVPLHAPAVAPFANTNDHLLGTLDWLAENPTLCPHLEMETYTWEVLPPELKTQNVVEQLAAEYEWTLAQMKARGLA